MKIKKRALFSIILYVLITSCVFCGITFAFSESDNINDKQNKFKIPTFALEALETKNSFFTNKIFNGKVSLLNIWSSKCKACKFEHDFLMKLPKNKNFQIIGINVDYTKKMARNFLKKQGNPYNVNMYDENGQFSQSFDVYAIPDVCLIDQKGVVLVRHLGNVTKDIWASKFQPILDKINNQN